MDILKKLLNNPAFDHLAENVISFMDTDEAMETMIESELLSDEERKVMRKMLRKLMVKEAQMYCEKEVKVYFDDRDQHYKRVLIKTTLYKMFPFFKDALQELKNGDTLKSFNQLYDVLVWLQPGESQLDDETQLQSLYDWSVFYWQNDDDIFNFKDFKGPEDMLEVFELADEDDEEYVNEDEDEDEDDYDGNDFEDWNYFSDDSMDFPGNKYDYDSIMEYGLQW